MQRREFLGAAGAATAISLQAASLTADEGDGGAPRQFFEWRTYRTKNEAKRKIVSDYLEHAALPAWKRIGLGAIGAFTELDSIATNTTATAAIHVVLATTDVALLLAA